MDINFNLLRVLTNTVQLPLKITNLDTVINKILIAFTK